MRARNIKPGFYKNEQLAECSVEARLLFPGLWMLADRKGRLVYRPKRWKGELFPYDSFDVGALFEELVQNGLVKKYEIDGTTYVWIPHFLEHQKPHQNETPSAIPAHPNDQEDQHDAPTNEEFTSMDESTSDHGAKSGEPRTRALRLNPESLLLNPESKKEENTYVVSDATKKKTATRTRHEYSPEYETFFAVYPARNGQKNGKHAGQQAFDKAIRAKSVTPEFLTERIIQLALQYGDYPPDIATWLNQCRWEDPVAEPASDFDRDLAAMRAETAKRGLQ